MKIYFSFETKLPGGHTRSLPIEDQIISFIPYTPDGYHEDFHEERMGKVVFSQQQFMMNLHFLIPDDA